MRTRCLYEFERFRLDPHEGVLLSEGRRQKLEPKDLEILLVLVENHGHTVGKEELFEKVWPGTFVEEGNLARHISVLRQVLGQGQSGPQYIETVPKRGYRFVAPVRQVDFPPAEVQARGRCDSTSRAHPTFRPAAARRVAIAAVVLLLWLEGHCSTGERPPLRGPIHPVDELRRFRNFPGALAGWPYACVHPRREYLLMALEQVYVKLLPDGEPFQLTNDNLAKMDPVFSPDAARIAYTTVDHGAWDTWVVPVPGGTPRLMLPNASGLSWIGESACDVL